ncbi:MAG: class I SAM-dependent methyltransferase [Chromatiaceae bacterium]|nr:class I SAM-dependent methyltransferase [Chromatiaceae bacterium]
MNRKATNPRGYRQVLYAKYVTGKTHTQKILYEQGVYVQRARAAEGCFKACLPTDRSAAILDVGCGHGNFLFMLEQLGYRNLEGVDMSSEQLEQAAAICQHARLLYDDAAICTRRIVL